MTINAGFIDSLKQAEALLQQRQQPQLAIDLVKNIDQQSPLFAQAQHLRAIAAFRLGDAANATILLSDAIRAGEHAPNALLNLAKIAGAANLPDTAVEVILESLKRRIPAEQVAAYTHQILENLGFTKSGAQDRKKIIFERLAMPLLEWALQGRLMDYAIMLESFCYERYVKSIETEAHFRSCFEQMAPPMSEAGRYWRDKLPPITPPPAAAPYKLGFFVHNASTLAHIEVLLNTLKGYRQLDEQPFEPTVYCFGGKSEAMEQALAMIGVRLVMLNERFPKDANSIWRRLLRLRELLAEEGVHGLVWISLVTIMPLAFAMRIAPVQIWWAMKYHSLELPDIDGYVTGGSITKYRMIDGRKWRNGRLGVDDWYDTNQESPAREIHAGYGGKLVLGSIGRTEKLADPIFLATVVHILRENPDCIFLWPGQHQDQHIQSAFDVGGVSDRTHFIGWVNTRLYAQVVDIFLDSFPFPSGFTLFQAMAAGKPVIIYESRESIETGLYAFIGPVLTGQEGTPEEQRTVRDLVSDSGDKFCISIAKTPDEYAALVQLLIDNSAWRERCGQVSKKLMAQYLSNPKVMGATNFQHLLEIMAERYPDLASVELKF